MNGRFDLRNTYNGFSRLFDRDIQEFNFVVHVLFWVLAFILDSPIEFSQEAVQRCGDAFALCV